MDSDIRNFWLGATWFVTLACVAAIIICGLVWSNRYMQFDHTHNHVHEEHEHSLEHQHLLPEHEHTYSLPDHEHPHTHIIREVGDNIK